MNRKCQLCDKPHKTTFYTKNPLIEHTIFKWYVCGVKHALQVLQKQIKEYNQELCENYSSPDNK